MVSLAIILPPIQGSASEIMRLAMIRLFEEINIKKNKSLKMLLQIHDELIFESDSNDVKSASLLIKNTMVSVKNSNLHSFSIPLLVDINIGDNLGLLH